MNSMKFPASMLLLLLVFLAASAIAQDNDPLGSAATTAANEDVRKSMADDLFSPAQDTRGVPTPVLMGKNAPLAQEPPKPKARLLSPSNKWHLDLRDTTDRVLDLELFQSNDAVFGNGTIVVEGVSQYVTATGTVTGNKLAMDVLTSDLSLFRIALTMSGKSLSGDYHSYSASYVPGQGIAMGKIS